MTNRYTRPACRPPQRNRQLPTVDDVRRSGLPALALADYLGEAGQRAPSRGGCLHAA